MMPLVKARCLGMPTKKLLVGAAVFLGSASLLIGEVVRAPLMGQIIPGSTSAAAWLSETRIWNPTASVATVSITDVVGIGNPSIRDFTIPPNGILDLRNFELFFSTDPPPSYYPSLLALVEFTSDQPVVLLTAISALEPDAISPGGDCPYLPYFGGSCTRPVAGPLLHGFHDYVAPGTLATLPWLTAGSGYRANLFITNPTDSSLAATATFRSVNGEIVATKVYNVAARSLVVFGDVLRDPEIRDQVGEGAVTATFVGDGEFYVFAAVLSESPACMLQPLYALVQPQLAGE